MRVILALWTDAYNQTFNQEVFSDYEDPEDILEHYKDCKTAFNRRVIALRDTGLAFSDGTEVNLFELPIQTVPMKKIKFHSPAQLEENIDEGFDTQ